MMTEEISEKLAKVHKILHSKQMILPLEVLMMERRLVCSRKWLFTQNVERFNISSKRAMDAVRLNTDDMMMIHISQLELISNLFMLMEDYLSYSFYLRKSILELPRALASDDTGIIIKEITHLEHLNAEEIYQYLQFPSLSQLKLDVDEKRSLKEMLNAAVQRYTEAIKTIADFNHNYWRVYNKYKHILPAIIGLYQDLGREVGSHIYVRDYYKNKGQTFVIPSGIEVIPYYIKVQQQLDFAFNLLLCAHIAKIVNLGTPCLVPEDFFIPMYQRRQWNLMVRKVNYVPVTAPNLQINFNFTTETSKALKASCSKNFIYELNQDIFEGSSHGFRTDNIGGQ